VRERMPSADRNNHSGKHRAAEIGISSGFHRFLLGLALSLRLPLFSSILCLMCGAFSTSRLNATRKNIKVNTTLRGETGQVESLKNI
ncbi:MAG: hypothetical protein WCA23_00445, partial [Stellaceae bacterium]